MPYIVQKNTVGHTTTIVVTEEWDQPLEEHPSIVENPDLFEIVDGDPPTDVQYLKYI